MDGNCRGAHLEGREALLKDREWSVGRPKGPGVVGKQSRWSGVVGRPSQRTGSGQEALPKSWEGVGRLSRRAGGGRQALPDVWE